MTFHVRTRPFLFYRMRDKMHKNPLQNFAFDTKCLKWQKSILEQKKYAQYNRINESGIIQNYKMKIAKGDGG